MFAILGRHVDEVNDNTKKIYTPTTSDGIEGMLFKFVCTGSLVCDNVRASMRIC